MPQIDYNQADNNEYVKKAIVNNLSLSLPIPALIVAPEEESVRNTAIAKTGSLFDGKPIVYVNDDFAKQFFVDDDGFNMLLAIVEHERGHIQKVPGVGIPGIVFETICSKKLVNTIKDEGERHWILNLLNDCIINYELMRAGIFRRASERQQLKLSYRISVHGKNGLLSNLDNIINPANKSQLYGSPYLLFMFAHEYFLTETNQEFRDAIKKIQKSQFANEFNRILSILNKRRNIYFYDYLRDILELIDVFQELLLKHRQNTNQQPQMQSSDKGQDDRQQSSDKGQGQGEGEGLSQDKSGGNQPSDKEESKGEGMGEGGKTDTAMHQQEGTPSNDGSSDGSNLTKRILDALNRGMTETITPFVEKNNQQIEKIINEAIKQGLLDKMNQEEKEKLINEIEGKIEEHNEQVIKQCSAVAKASQLNSEEIRNLCKLIDDMMKKVKSPEYKNLLIGSSIKKKTSSFPINQASFNKTTYLHKAYTKKYVRDYLLKDTFTPYANTKEIVKTPEFAGAESTFMAEACFIVDTSGSISKNELVDMLAVILSLFRQYKPPRLSIIMFHTEAYNTITLEAHQLNMMSLVGEVFLKHPIEVGGTVISSGVSACRTLINRQQFVPGNIILLTDGETYRSDISKTRELLGEIKKGHPNAGILVGIAHPEVKKTEMEWNEIKKVADAVSVDANFQKTILNIAKKIRQKYERDRETIVSAIPALQQTNSLV